MLMINRKVLAGVASAALAFSLAACGGSDSEGTTTPSESTDTSTSTETDAAACTTPTPVKLQLQWFNQAQFAGYYAADAEGYYADACLDVEILEGGADVVPQQILEQGGADYAVSWAPKVLGDIEAGNDLVNIAQIFQRSAPLLVSLKDKGIATPADMLGKKWVNWGFGNQWELLAMLQGAGGLTPEESAYDAEGDTGTNLFQDGYDAATAMTYNEWAQLLETVNPDTGELYTPDDFNVLDPNEYDATMLEDGIWAMGDKLADPAFQATTEAFIYASLKGWIYVRDNLDDAASLSTDYGSTLPTGHQTWMANEINKLIWPSPDGIGTVDPDAWTRTVSLSKTVIDPATGTPLITADPPSTTIDQSYVEKALAKLEEEGVDTTGADWKPTDITLTEGGE